MKAVKYSRKLWKSVTVFLGVGVLLFCLILRVRAEEKAVIVQTILKEESLCLFLDGLGEYDDVTGQIGRESVEVINTGHAVSGHTIILIDNSLSVTKENFEKAVVILTQYIQNKEENEKISLAVFGTDIQYLMEKETDGEAVIEALKAITSEDKDTYLTDVLYDELQKLENKTEYTRFIVVTDGVDNKEIGYNKEELSAYLEKNRYPVYALGCKYKNNEEELKNLFAISRATKAEYYLLDDYEEYDEIIGALCESVTCVEIEIPEEFRDGSSRNILLTFEGKGGMTEASVEVSMPFGLREEPEPEPIEESEKEETLKEEIPEPSPVPEPEPVLEEELVVEPEKESSVDFVSIAAMIVVVLALVVLILVNQKKKKENQDGAGSDKRKKRAVETVGNRKGGKKERNILDMLSEPEASELEMEENGTILVSSEEESGTVFLDSSEQAKYLVVLKDNQDHEKVFKYPLFDKVVIGRRYETGVNIVLNYEATVSAKHCEISMRGNRFFVRDLHSSNKTFLNGREVGGYTEFTSGSNLRLGNLDMTIEIEQAAW